MAEGSLLGEWGPEGVSLGVMDPEEMAREIGRFNQQFVDLRRQREIEKNRDHTGRGPVAGYALIDQMRHSPRAPFG